MSDTSLGSSANTSIDLSESIFSLPTPTLTPTTSTSQFNSSSPSYSTTQLSSPIQIISKRELDSPPQRPPPSTPHKPQWPDLLSVLESSISTHIQTLLTSLIDTISDLADLSHDLATSEPPHPDHFEDRPWFSVSSSKDFNALKVPRHMLEHLAHRLDSLDDSLRSSEEGDGDEGSVFKFNFADTHPDLKGHLEDFESRVRTSVQAELQDQADATLSDIQTKELTLDSKLASLTSKLQQTHDVRDRLLQKFGDEQTKAKRAERQLGEARREIERLRGEKEAVVAERKEMRGRWEGEVRRVEELDWELERMKALSEEELKTREVVTGERDELEERIEVEEKKSKDLSDQMMEAKEVNDLLEVTVQLEVTAREAALLELDVERKERMTGEIELEMAQRTLKVEKDLRTGLEKSLEAEKNISLTLRGELDMAQQDLATTQRRLREETMRRENAEGQLSRSDQAKRKLESSLIAVKAAEKEAQEQTKDAMQKVVEAEQRYIREKKESIEKIGLLNIKVKELEAELREYRTKDSEARRKIEEERARQAKLRESMRKAEEERRREEERKEMERERKEREREERRKREKQEKRAREEEKRKEKAQREARSRQRSDRAILEAWTTYETDWTTISSTPTSSTRHLTFVNIRWPMANPPFNSQDITFLDVRDFILSPLHSEGQSHKQRVRNALLRWHPDKFARVVEMVIAKDQAEVKAGAETVARYLNQIMESL